MSALTGKADISFRSAFGQKRTLVELVNDSENTLQSRSSFNLLGQGFHDP